MLNHPVLLVSAVIYTTSVILLHFFHNLFSSVASKRGGIQNVSEKEGAIELALDPSELDMDNDAMAMRYEQQLKEQQSHLQKEDLSDMLAEHVAKQKTKRKRQQTQDGKQAKKYKEFKF